MLCDAMLFNANIIYSRADRSLANLLILASVIEVGCRLSLLAMGRWLLISINSSNSTGGFSKASVIIFMNSLSRIIRWPLVLFELTKLFFGKLNSWTLGFTGDRALS